MHRIRRKFYRLTHRTDHTVTITQRYIIKVSCFLLQTKMISLRFRLELIWRSLYAWFTFRAYANFAVWETDRSFIKKSLKQVVGRKYTHCKILRVLLYCCTVEWCGKSFGCELTNLIYLSFLMSCWKIVL